MKRITIAVLILAVLPAVARADETVQREMKRDVVLRALVDELERGRTGLKLEDMERPYFLEYALVDGSSASVTARLGAVISKNVYRSRRLRTDVRVGSYELDNTNFSGGYGGFGFGGMGGFFGRAPIPVEDDYTAIRQGIWWATDREYKKVIETLAKKRAFMESKVIEDKPDDFSRETPAAYFEDPASVSIDIDRLQTLAVSLSGLFREHAEVKRSTVSASAQSGNKYMVNSEGARLRTAGTRCSLTVNATVQAHDGMEFSDSLSVYTRRVDELPDLEELAGRCRKMIKELVALKNAPKLDTYTGPVLFEPQAAAALFSHQLARRFAGGQRPLGSRTSADDFSNKIGKRILPRFVDVIDDPTRETIAGVPAMGHYKYDDQGIPARPLTLVDDGRLKALVMSRNPSKERSNSTGHGRNVMRPRASVASFVVTADPAADTATLKRKLLEACQDEDLEYGLRIASLSGSTPYNPYASFGFADFDFGGFDGFRRGRGTTPLAVYKVFPDGREELVRGAEIARIDLKAFKRILAMGIAPYVHNTGGSSAQTFAVPALLFDELDLAKIDRDFDKPPILPTPLARR